MYNRSPPLVGDGTPVYRLKSLQVILYRAFRRFLRALLVANAVAARRQSLPSLVPWNMHTFLAQMGRRSRNLSNCRFPVPQPVQRGQHYYAAVSCTFFCLLVSCVVVLTRERSDGLYMPLTYLVAKVLEEVIVALVQSLIMSCIVFFPLELSGSWVLFWLTYFITTVVGICALQSIPWIQMNYNRVPPGFLKASKLLTSAYMWTFTSSCGDTSFLHVFTSCR